MSDTITIRDLAACAQTSTATVSRVLNDTGPVSHELKERVLEAAKDLHYSPNGIARSLKQSNTRTVGVMISDITNPFFASVVRGIEDMLADKGYLALLCNTDLRAEKEKLYLRLLSERRVDGMIISAASRAPQHFKILRQRRIPWVFVNRRSVGFGGPAVLTDNRWGAFEACNHLIQLGHRRLGILAGPQDINTGIDRLLGYCDSLAVHDLLIDDDLIVIGKFSEESGYNGVQRLMSLPLDRRPTALFTSNNSLAIGAIQAMIELKLRMPDDIAFVTFDDSEWARIANPPVTTVAQRQYEMGQIAAELLLDTMAADILPDEDAPLHDTLLKPKLIVRHSCGAQPR